MDFINKGGVNVWTYSYFQIFHKEEPFVAPLLFQTWKKKEIDLVFPNKAHCPCMVPNSEGTNTRNRIIEYIVAWISQFLKSGKTFGLCHTAFWKSIKYFYQNITKSLQLHSSSCRKLKTRKAGFGYYTTRSGITRFNNCHTQKSQ